MNKPDIRLVETTYPSSKIRGTEIPMYPEPMVQVWARIEGTDWMILVGHVKKETTK